MHRDSTSRTIVGVFTRVLWGAGRRPKASFADGTPEHDAYLDDIISEAGLYRVMNEATPRALTIGTGLVVWRLQKGKLRAEVWDAKYARPTFVPGEFPMLQKLDYRFKFTREVPNGRGGEACRILAPRGDRS